MLLECFEADKLLSLVLSLSPAMAAIATTLPLLGKPSPKPRAQQQLLLRPDRSPASCLVLAAIDSEHPPDNERPGSAGVSHPTVDRTRFAPVPVTCRRGVLLGVGAGAASAISLCLQQASNEARALSSFPEEDGAAPDRTITDRVYLDICKCPTTFNTSREIGGGPVATTAPSSSSSSSSPSPSFSSSVYRCDDATSLGRIVIGLYGKQVPRTVANFKAMCTGAAGSSYRACLIHRILAGQYIVAGKQGSSKERGEVLPPSNLQRNPETISANAFKLRHSRPGTVSLCLSENDDEDQFKLSTSYRNVEFLITTGPGPAPQLDNKNIVFGTVLEGLDVVTAIAAVPTYKPSERIRQFNEFASFIGDGRASNARNFWYRPLKALYISDCGEL